VVGEVVRLRDSLAWYERLPLFGLRVLVTRAEAQAGGLTEALRAAGAESVALPLLRIVPCEDVSALDRALDALESYDVLLLTSANAVRLLAARAAARGIALAREGLRIACVGPATAKAAGETGLSVDFVPADRFDAEGLLAALEAWRPLAGLRFLLPRSAAARDALPEGLRARGARVDAIALYRPEAAPADAAWLRGELLAGRLDALTFTSPSAVRHFCALLDEPSREAAGRSVVVAIGPVTAAALREAGLDPHVVAGRAEGEALVEGLAGYFERAGGRA
jgi:uroporphyrinogen III methyltransferase/synthase